MSSEDGPLDPVEKAEGHLGPYSVLHGSVLRGSDGLSPAEIEQLCRRGEQLSFFEEGLGL